MSNENLGMTQYEANANIIANTMGPTLSNALYKTLDGTPYYEKYGGQVSLPANLEQAASGGSNGGSGQQFTGVDNRYAAEQTRQFEQSGGQAQFTNQVPQATNQFSGYGEPNPAYGAQQNQGYGYQQPQTFGVEQPYREWKVSPPQQPQVSNQLRDRLPTVFGRPITGVRKDGRGNIEAFRLEDGTVLNYGQMLQANMEGGFKGLRVQHNREGELIIRSVPDGYTDNNLDNLPQF